jgi:hypothetical protein
MPQFPDGTELLLVRQMNLFDRDGSLVNALITESVQIRVFREGQTASENVYELRLDRAKLFAGKAGGLRTIARDEQDFTIFNARGSTGSAERNWMGARTAILILGLASIR